MRESGVTAPRQFAGMNVHVRWRVESMTDSGRGVVRGMRGAALSWFMGRVQPVFGSVGTEEGRRRRILMRGRAQRRAKVIHVSFGHDNQSIW